MLLLASECHEPQPPEILKSILDRFEQSFAPLLDREHYADAFLIASTYSYVLTSKVGATLRSGNLNDPGRLLKVLRSRPHLPGLIKANVLQKMSADNTQPGGTSDLRSVVELEDEAIDLFKAGGHRFGAIAIQIQRECRDITLKSNDLDQILKRISTNLEQLEDVDNILELQIAIKNFANAVAQFHNFDFDLILSNRALEIAEKSGAYITHCMFSVGILGHWLLTTGRAPTAIESGEKLFQSLDKTDANFLKGNVARIVAQAYAQLEDYDRALIYADKCALSWSRDHPANRAEAATEQLRAKLHTNTRSDEADELVSEAQQLAKQEGEAGLVDSAIDKLQWLFIYLVRKHDPRIPDILQDLERLLGRIPADNSVDRDTKQANLFQNISNALLTSAKQQSDTLVEEQCDQLLDKAAKLYLKHNNLVYAANTRQMQGMLNISRYQKANSRENLDRALGLFSTALDAFRLLGVSSMSVEAAYWCSFILFEGWRRRWTENRRVLEALAIAEEERAKVRSDMAIFGGSQAIELKQRYAGEQKIMAIYRHALEVCLTDGLDEDLWSWIQRGKARSVSDLLGLATVTPSTIKSRIEADPSMKELFEKEVDLIRKLESADPLKRASIRGDLHVLRSQMREFKDLKNLMELREGNPILLHQLHALAESPQLRRYGSVVFADWFMFNGQVYLCSVKDQEQPSVHSCNMSQQEIEQWKATWIDGLGGLYQDTFDDDDDECCLRKLDNLIRPLQLISKPGDLIVCSASGVLHAIPLHALWIEQGPLILRNHVIYCASQTTFAQCFHRAAETTPSKGSRTVFAVYEEGPETSFFPKEQQPVYSSADTLGSTLQADVYSGLSAEISLFEAAIQESTLFHFHGHCLLGKANVADQALVLGDGNITVKDLFGLRLPHPHITLIACGSGSQGISAGDEPLGLVTALLCAGASSVLGTLWPTRSITGREFSALFYEQLDKANSHSLLDLADALRAAVLELREERSTRRPADWAAFVLHGSCFRVSS